ncbi:MAG TPA: protein kinase [Polyangiaceae bacterium]
MTKTRDELIGALVLGRYRIVRPLAQGGMGAVYLARVEGAAGFSKPVVIKRVLPHLNDVKHSKAQFVREARILSNLQHPGIVGVIDFAEERGALLMVLDYVHGYHIGQWLKYLRETSRQLPWEVGVLVILRVLSALHYAHTFTRSDGSRAEIVHRDVSPGNILLDLDGNVRLLDFGIALMTEDKGNYQTQDGTFKGKLPYVAPEIYASEKATPKSDVYAAGVVLYQLLTGENPFAAKDMSATVRRVLTLEPPPIRATRKDVPPELDRVIATAIAKDTRARFQTADAFAAELRALLPRREDEVVAELSAMIRADFTGDMPKLLHIHTLELLEATWRDAQAGFEESFTPLKSSVPPTVREKLIVSGVSANLGDDIVKPAPPPPLERRGVSGRQLVLAVIAAALLAGGVATAAVLLTRPATPPTAQRFLVVEADGARQLTAAAPAASAVEAEADLRTIDVDSVPRLPGSSAPAPEHASKPSNQAPGAGDTAAQLSRAFARKQAAIQGCFQAHTQNLEGNPHLAIRFSVDAAGKVTSAAVQPATLASTALGQCLQGVARSTEFGPQPEARSFTIPIHARAASK